MFFSIVTALYNHHDNLFLEHFCHIPPQIPYALGVILIYTLIVSKLYPDFQSNKMQWGMDT